MKRKEHRVGGKCSQVSERQGSGGGALCESIYGTWKAEPQKMDQHAGPPEGRMAALVVESCHHSHHHLLKSEC